jgi:hypothetical protein
MKRANRRSILPVRAYRRSDHRRAGRKLMPPAQTSRTDDRGRYRFARLTPGDYIVVVAAHGNRHFPVRPTMR